MKFIIPQNYTFKNKIWGIFDYSTVLLNIFWYALIFIILNILFKNWNIKIFLLISFCLPITLFSIVGFNKEPITYIFKYIIKYIVNPKLYLYKKY